MRALRSLGILCAVATIVVILPAAAQADEIDLEDTVYGGIYSSKFLPKDDLNALASVAGGRVTFAGMFHDMLAGDGVWPWSNVRESLDQAWLAKATPFVNVHVGSVSAAAIANGSYDAQINTYAARVELFLDKGGNRSLILAPMQEMNGTWTSYGCTPGNFKAAYKRIVDIFRNRGIDETKVRWAFAPNGWSSPGCGSIADYYPGDGYVDILSFSGYNFGNCAASWHSPSWVLDGPIDALAGINPTKPILVAQTGAPKWCSTGGTGGDQAAWVRSLFDYVRAKENVAGFIWFNIYKYEPSFGVTMDWRIWDPNWASQGWKDRIPSADHQHPLTDWFRPGPLTIKPVAIEQGTRPCSSSPCDSVGLVNGGGKWSLLSALSAQANENAFYFGNPGDIPFMGDWDGDGIATPGLYRQSDGFVYLRNSNTQGVADVTFFFGNPGDYPLIGDFNKDGKDTVSIFRSSEARVYVVNKLGQNGGGLGKADYSYAFGNPGDKPFVGDFNGNGQDTVGLYRTSTGYVYFRNSLTTGIADFEFFYGNPGDVILAGDWDGDGDDTVAVYRPSTSRVYINLENAAGNADYTLWVGSFPHAVTFGRE